MLNDPLWLVNEYRNARKTTEGAAKGAAKLLGFLVSSLNRWDFNRKLEKRLADLNDGIQSLLRTHNGVLVEINYDELTGMEKETTLIFQGAFVVGAGSNYNLVWGQRHASLIATACSPDRIRGKSCKPSSAYLWITLFGTNFVVPSGRALE